MSRSRARRYVGIALGALTLYLTFRELAFDDLLNGLRHVSAPFAIAALLTVILTVLAVAVRWRFILSAAGVGATWHAVFVAVVLGQASNIVFPFRSGEAARAYVLAAAARRPLMQVGGTIIIERVFDVAMLVAASAALLVAGALPVSLAVARLLTTIAVVAITVTALAILASWSAGIRFAHPALEKLRTMLAPATRSLRALHGWSTVSALAVMTAVTFLLAASTNYLLFRAFGINLSMLAALVVLIALQVGTTVASVPGNLGVFQYVSILVLVGYGVARVDAVAYAWSLYGLTVLPRVAAGAALMMTGHWSVQPTDDRRSEASTRP